MLFASWGTPDGSCTGAVGTSSSFKKGSCDEKDTVAKVKALCVGKHMCKVPAGPAGASDGSGGNDLFGDPCPSTPKRLAVVISCATGAWGGTFILFLFIFGLLYLGEQRATGLGSECARERELTRVRLFGQFSGWRIVSSTGIRAGRRTDSKSCPTTTGGSKRAASFWKASSSAECTTTGIVRAWSSAPATRPPEPSCSLSAAGGIPYEPVPQAPVAPGLGGGAGAAGGAQAGTYGAGGTWSGVCALTPTAASCCFLPDPLTAHTRTARLCSQTGPAGGDDALWSDEESDGDADFRTAKAILESALPELEDGEEWATDSEEEFE